MRKTTDIISKKKAGKFVRRLFLCLSRPSLVSHCQRFALIAALMLIPVGAFALFGIGESKKKPETAVKDTSKTAAQPKPLSPAQQKIKQQADSIEARLPQLKGKEIITAIRNLFQLSVKLSDEQRQYYWLDRMKEEARKQNDDSTYAYAGISKLGVMYNYGHTDELFDSVPPYMEEMKKMKFEERYYFAWSMLCDVDFFKGRYFHTLRLAMAMHKEAVETNSEIGTAWALWELGQLYMGMGADQQAYEYLKKATQILYNRPQREYGSLSRTFNRYCGVLSVLKKYDEMKEATEQWDECLKEWRKSLKAQGLATTATVFHQISCNKYKSEINVKNRRYKEGLQIIEESEKEVSGMSRLVNGKITDMKMIYYMSVNDYPTAMKYIEEIIDLGKNRGKNTMLQGEQGIKADVLIRMGKYDDATKLLMTILPLKDSVNNASLMSSVSEINTLFELDEQTAAAEREIRAQKQKNLKLIMAGAFLVLVILPFYFFSRTNMLKKLKKSRAQLTAANKELRSANNKIMESDRMKEVFMLHMGNEVRKPLGDITKFIKQINSTENTQTPEERTRMLEEIQHSTNSITATVNQLLELSDVESKGDLERGDDITTTELCEKAVKTARPQKHKNIEFVFTPEEGTPTTISTNAKYAEKLLTYLINNAYIYTKEGSVALTCRTDEENAVFSIADTGVGIPDNRKDHIFGTEVEGNVFNSPSDINLCVCQCIAKRLGGDIKLEKTGPGGSEFIVTLPLQG